MQSFAVNAKSLITPGLTFPADGSNVKVEHVYNDGCADLLTKLWLTHDEYRGTLVICPRCQGASRGLHHAPNRRGLCCVACLSRLKRIEDEREARQTSRKPAKPVQKSATAISEISENKPANKSGRGSPDLSRKKISANKKGRLQTEISAVAQNATNKKGQPAKRRQSTGRKPARKAA